METTVYLGLGSNQGNSEEILAGAVKRLGENLLQMRASSLYLTAPRDVADQPSFLNMAVSGGRPEGSSPSGLLDILHAIEADAGRCRSRERKKGPRTLDIDIILWGEDVISLPRLQIPHPAYLEREFVLTPLLELDPELRDPASGEPLSRIQKELHQGVYFYRSLSL